MWSSSDPEEPDELEPSEEPDDPEELDPELSGLPLELDELPEASGAGADAAGDEPSLGALEDELELPLEPLASGDMFSYPEFSSFLTDWEDEDEEELSFFLTSGAGVEAGGEA